MLHVVLFQPEIPYNTGNIGRTCVAVGAKLWLIRPLGFQLDDRHLRRAGMDYWQRVDCEVVDDWDAWLMRAQPSRLWLFTKTATKNYAEARFQRGDALVFGNESSGLPSSLRIAQPEQCLRIPMLPEARCLNLAVSVGIAVYEALRQWHADNTTGP